MFVVEAIADFSETIILQQFGNKYSSKSYNATLTDQTQAQNNVSVVNKQDEDKQDEDKQDESKEQIGLQKQTQVESEVKTEKSQEQNPQSLKSSNTQVSSNEDKQNQQQSTNQQEAKVNQKEDTILDKKASQEKEQKQPEIKTEKLDNQDLSKQTESTNQCKQQQFKYLSFKKGDKILTIQIFQNGWWYGKIIYQVCETEQESEDELQGYFPSNYVKTVSELDNVQQISRSDKDLSKFDWSQYAEQFLHKDGHQDYQQENDDDYDEEVEIRRQQYFSQLKRDALGLEEGGNQLNAEFGIKGYKKIKITEQNEKILDNPQVRYSEDKQFVYLPIKSQAPLEKSYRQLNHYFDYDKWVENMNEQGQQKKAKPDPSKKKDKQQKKYEQLKKQGII